MWSICMEIGVRSPDMEEYEVVEEEPYPRKTPGESLHRLHFQT
jgi:hypothetical protein